MLRTQSSVIKALLRHGMKSLMRTCVVPAWIDDDIPQSDWAPASLRQRRSAWHRHPAHLSTHLARLRLGNWETGKTGTGMGATTNLEDWSRLQQTLGVYIYIYIYILFIYLDIKDQKRHIWYTQYDINILNKRWVSDYITITHGWFSHRFAAGVFWIIPNRPVFSWDFPSTKWHWIPSSSHRFRSR